MIKVFQSCSDKSPEEIPLSKIRKKVHMKMNPKMLRFQNKVCYFFLINIFIIKPLFRRYLLDQLNWFQPIELVSECPGAYPASNWFVFLQEKISPSSVFAVFIYLFRYRHWNTTFLIQNFFTSLLRFRAIIITMLRHVSEHHKENKNALEVSKKLSQCVCSFMKTTEKHQIDFSLKFINISQFSE